MPLAIRSIFMALALLAGLSVGSPLTANPFTGSQEARDESPAVQRAWGPVATVGRALLAFQREANRLIAQHMDAIRDGKSSAALLIGIGLAFLYGVVHALGPGHGKLVVVSYFLSRDARVGRGLLMGLQIAVFHVISAVVVVVLADLLLRRAFGGGPSEVVGVRLLSYGLIAAIGVVMLVQAFRRSRLRRAGVSVHSSCCGAHHPADGRAADVGEQTRQGALSLGVGLVPCTGAVLILLYAMANDILFAGVVLAIAIAAGMAITMGVLGIVSVIARQAVTRRIDTGSSGRGTLAEVSDYAGALAITTIGCGLLWVTL